jgi:plastocyanin
MNDKKAMSPFSMFYVLAVNGKHYRIVLVLPVQFTIGAPYNIDKNVPAEQNETIVFKANHEGIFQYYCKYHLPTMQGQLIVTR